MSPHPHYILKNGKPVQEQDVLEWAQWFEGSRKDRIVEQTKIKQGKTKLKKIFISTVFLGLDHSWGLSAKPTLWETMVFNGPSDGYHMHYASLIAAKKGHAQTVAQEKRIQTQKRKE